LLVGSLLVFLAGGAICHAEGKNLVQNPGFEMNSNADGVPDSWKLNAIKGGKGKIEPGGHEGKYAMVFDCAGGEADCYFNQKITIKPNTDYTLSFWYKTERKPSWGSIVIFLGKEKPLRTAVNWTKQVITLNSGTKTETDLQFVLYHRNARFYIDEVKLEEGKEATPFSKEATPAISPVSKKPASTVSPAKSSANLVQNPGFETDSNGDGVPDGWEYTQRTGGTCTLIKGGHGGKSCVVARGTGGTSEAWITQMIEVKPNTDYVLTFWYKTDRTGGGNMYAGLDKDKTVPNATEWTKHTKQVNSGGKNQMKVLFLLYRRSNSYYIDDVQVVGKGGAAEAKEERKAPLALGTNLVKNPGFEIDSNADGVPDSWKLTAMKGGKGKIEQGGHEGQYAMVFDCPGGEADCYFNQKITIKSNTDYTLSFWYKTKRNDPWGKHAIFLGKEIALRDAPAGWTKYVLTLNSGSKTETDLQFILYHRNALFYIDEVKVEEGKEATPFSKEAASAVSPKKKWSASEVVKRQKNKAANPNLLPNASFEWKKTSMSFEELGKVGTYGWGTATDQLVGWDTNCRNGKVAYVGDTAYDGWSSILFCDTISSTGGRKGYEGYIIFRKDVQLEAGKHYTLSAAMKTENLQTPEGPYVGIINEGWTWEDIRLKPASPTSDWKVYAQSFLPPSSPYYQIVVVMNPLTKGKVWFDAIKLEEGKRATAFVDQAPPERILKIENPLFKEVLSNEPPRFKKMLYYGYNCNASKFRAFAKKFAHRYVLAEQWKELSANNLVHISHSVDDCIEWKAPLVVKLGGKSDAPLVFGSRGRKSPWLLDPKVQDAYIKSVSEKIGKYQGQGLWGLWAGDEVMAGAMTHFVPEGARYAAVDEADKEIKEKYGFGKFGIPLAPSGEQLSKHLAVSSPKNPYVLIAYRRWVNDKMTQMYKRAYQEAKKLNPNIVMIGETSIGSSPATDYEAMAGYFDVFSTQILDYLMKVGDRNPFIPMIQNGCETKIIADLTGKPVCPLVQNGDYMGSPSAEETRERYSQVFRNGGAGIMLLAVEWFDRELNHHKFCAPERWKALLEICKQVNTMNRVKLPKDPDVAILYPTYTLLGQPGPYRSQSMLTNYALVGPLSGAWFKFVSDRQIERGIKNLNDFKLLYIPYCKYERPQIVRKFQDFVSNGGTLVMTDPQCFATDINGDDITKFREELFGIKVGKGKKAKNIITDLVWHKKVKLPVKGGSYNLTVMSGVEVVAKFEDGTPAITIKKQGQGKAIFFAHNPFKKSANIDYDAPWVKFFIALQKDMGIKMNRKIWRFKFPPVPKTPTPQNLCLTGNNVFFDANCPLDRYNLKTGGSYGYSYAPSGNSDVLKGGEISFAKGHLTDRPKAANNRLLGRWVSESKAEIPRWTVSWRDRKETSITFDLKKNYKVDSLRLFYSNQLPKMVVEGSVDKQNWQKLASSKKEQVTLDVLDKSYSLKGNYRYLRLNFGERDAGQSLTLVEVEIWGGGSV